MRYYNPPYRNALMCDLYPKIIRKFKSEEDCNFSILRHSRYYCRVYKKIKERHDLFYFDSNLRGSLDGMDYGIPMPQEQQLVRILEMKLIEIPLFINSPIAMVAYVAKWRLEQGI